MVFRIPSFSISSYVAVVGAYLEQATFFVTGEVVINIGVAEVIIATHQARLEAGKEHLRYRVYSHILAGIGKCRGSTVVERIALV